MSQYNCFPAADFANLVKGHPKDILNLMLEIAESSRQHPDTAYVVPFSSIPTEPPPEHIKMKDFGWLYAGHQECRNIDLPKMDTVRERIADLMPFSDDLSWQGYVAAGSFAVLACQASEDRAGIDPNCKPGDVDFYPYCSHKDREDLSIQEAAMMSYRQFLDDMTDAVSIFSSTITRRNANCTTIVVEPNYMHPPSPNALIQYQMIHRAHTSATSVIVGFDQMACKAFYDGDMVYFTLDAALCLYFGINPVDWRRESPSHMRRVLKYQQYGYGPIFPGLSLDLLTALGKSNDKAYYLPGCLLMHRYYSVQSYAKKSIDFGSERDERHSEIYLEFESYDVDCYVKYLSEPQNLGQHQMERAMVVKNNYLNLEQMPAVPFSKEAKESDYSAETTVYMAQCYHVLALTIREKYNLFSLYNDEAPNLIIDEGQGIDVRHTLEKTITGSSSDFYFGTDRVRKLQKKMTKLILTNHSHSISVRMVSRKQLEQLANLQQELREIFDARVKELEALVEPQVKKLQAGIEFITSNPGGQFTASFKPIIRKRPQDYWGVSYVPVEASRLRKLKLTLLCIRKYHSAAMKLLDSNIMKLIFEQLDMAYFRHAALPEGIVYMVGQSKHEVPSAVSLVPSSMQALFK